jgi:hypothetical protein
MTILQALWYYLWIAPHVLQVVIASLMVRRGLHRRFPAFFVYTIFEIVQLGVLLGVSRLDRGAYSATYAGGLAISAAIRFWVIYELYVYFFHNYPTLNVSGRALFRGATLALLLLAVGIAVLAPSAGPDGPVRASYTLDRTVSILQGGLLIVLFLFSKYFSLSWRTHAFGIALGLGVFPCVGLATSAIWLSLGTSSAYGNMLLNMLSMAVYQGCVVVWLVYLFRTETAPRPVPEVLPTQNLALWNQELERLLQQ